MQKLEFIHFAGCLMNLVYRMYPQESHSPSECLASYRSLQEQLQSVPNCVILVPLSGLIESTKLILACDSHKRFEDLSLEIFLSEWKRAKESHWCQGSYFATKYLVFTLWKRWQFLKYLLITSVLYIILPVSVKPRSPAITVRLIPLAGCTC